MRLRIKVCRQETSLPETHRLHVADNSTLQQLRDLVQAEILHDSQCEDHIHLSLNRKVGRRQKARLYAEGISSEKLPSLKTLLSLCRMSLRAALTPHSKLWASATETLFGFWATLRHRRCLRCQSQQHSIQRRQRSPKKTRSCTMCLRRQSQLSALWMRWPSSCMPLLWTAGSCSCRHASLPVQVGSCPRPQTCVYQLSVCCVGKCRSPTQRS